MKLKKGFTLIELLVVIAIIGMLSSVVLASLNGARAKARDAKRRIEKNQVISALNLYYSTNNAWPASLSGGSAWSCIGPSSETCWNAGYSGLDSLVTALTPYISKIPTTDADSGHLANNRLLYISNICGGCNGAGTPAGAYLLWEVEGNVAANECTVGPFTWDADAKYKYCYQFLGAP